MSCVNVLHIAIVVVVVRRRCCRPSLSLFNTLGNYFLFPGARLIYAVCCWFFNSSQMHDSLFFLLFFNTTAAAAAAAATCSRSLFSFHLSSFDDSIRSFFLSLAWLLVFYFLFFLYFRFVVFQFSSFFILLSLSLVPFFGH